MAEEEIIDAESSTLTKNAGPLEHLRHLIAMGWDPRTPLVVKFTEKHNLEDELIALIKNA